MVIAPALRTNPYNNSDPGMESRMLVVHALSAEGHDASEDGTGRGTPLVTAPTLRGGEAGQGSHGKPSGSDQRPMINTSPSAVRRLTPLEAERLQDFPDSWTCLCGATEAMLAELGIPYGAWRLSSWRAGIRLEGHTARCRCPDSPRYRALGNAVTVAVIEWLARRIVAASA